MFKKTKSIWSIHGEQNEYICTSLEDLEKLPKFGVRGTQDDDEETNQPCMYGSTALVCDGSNTEAYILNADNEWTKL